MLRTTTLLILIALTALLSSCGGRGLNIEADLSSDGNKSVAQVSDADFDGIRDRDEQKLGTDPERIDSDGDGITDQYELWGVSGIPIGAQGPLSGLPDMNGNGVIAALDAAEAGGAILSGKAASALEDTRLRVSAPGADPLENDLDRDFIPSDFELQGFYYEIDPVTGEDWFVKWDGDPNRNYYKTDPTKWSSDADPWSDWEEATKRNLDQRVKHPGDHPCIPAYPEIQAVLTSYTVEDASKIESSTGKSTQSSWTNSVSTKDTTTTDWNVNITASLEYEHKTEVNVLGNIDHDNTVAFSAKVSGHYGSSTSHESSTARDTSGLTSEEWSSAIAGDTINTAKLILNLKLLNTGTLPANNARVLFNLRLGDFIVDSFLVLLTAENGYGELEALGQNSVDYVVSNNGKGNVYVPPKDLFLSMQQLRALHLGAPLSIELVGFEAQTLVSEFDSETGRRVNLNIGPWSPYQSALENSTARLILDLGDDAAQPSPQPGTIAPRRTSDLRVFSYDNTGSYIGSPPVVTMRDALRWAFDSRETLFGPAVTITDPVSRSKRSEFLSNFHFGFDLETYNQIRGSQKLREDMFSLPIRPSNPSERVYVIQAPALVIPGESIDQSKPRVYSAVLTPYAQARREVRKPIPPPLVDDPNFKFYDPDNPPMVFDRYVYVPQFSPVVRVLAQDREGIAEVRFVPSHGSVGERMTYADDPDHPERGGSWEYRVPEHYIWTGFEQVIAFNLDGEASPPQSIVLQVGGYLDESDALITGANRDPFGYGTHTSLVKDPNTGSEIAATTFVEDLANDFNVMGVKVGDIVKNPLNGTEATVDTVTSNHRLELTWTSNPADPAKNSFKYGQRYVVLTGSKRYDTLGYEEQAGQRGTEPFELPAGSRQFGLNFTNTQIIKSAPFDLKIVEAVTGSAIDRRLVLDKAVGLATIGLGALDKWEYGNVRKATFATADIELNTTASQDAVYAVRLVDGRIAKFKIVFVDETLGSTTVKRLSAVDWVIYKGI